MEHRKTLLKQNEPFLRWAGGKNWFVKHLSNFLPKTFKNYHEPFLGGGSIFFNIDYQNKAFLSDLNSDLINTYIQVRDNVNDVLRVLKSYKNTKENYYIIRAERLEDNITRAAQFIYLNKTSFNGIYRVNRQGCYNVPFGYRHTIDFVAEENLKKCSLALQKTLLSEQDFTQSLKKVKANDLVFIDPPYTVAHENNGFIAYNQKLFSLDDQYALAECLRKLTDKGAFFILTNAFHTTIREVYKDLGEFIPLERASLIGGKKAKREVVKEYVIKNF